MTVSALAPILAHQSNWDETLLVIVPIAFFAWILYVANKRAAAVRRDRAENAEYLSPPRDDVEHREL